MTEIWQTLAAYLAGLIHTTPELAGILIGMFVLTTILVAFLVLYAVLDMRVTPVAIAIPAIVAIAFVGMTGWFPPWLILFLIILAAAVIGHRFSNGGSD